MQAFDNKLAEMSHNALSQQDLQFRSFLNKLSHLDNLNLNRVEQFHFNAHYMPLTSESGFHSALAFLPRSSRFKP